MCHLQFFFRLCHCHCRWRKSGCIHSIQAEERGRKKKLKKKECWTVGQYYWPGDFLLTPVRRLLITNCLLCSSHSILYPLTTPSTPKRIHGPPHLQYLVHLVCNFRCIIYGQFNEPQKNEQVGLLGSVNYF